MKFQDNNQAIFLTGSKNNFITTCENIDDSFCNRLKNIINIDKKELLLLNFENKNYLISKCFIPINSQIFNLYSISHYRLSNTYSEISDVDNMIFSYSDLSESQKLLVFACLMGYRTNKEIVNFLETYGFYLNNNINYCMHTLLNIFNVSDRNELTRKFFINGYDAYLPNSIFPTGIYNRKLELIKKLQQI